MGYYIEVPRNKGKAAQIVELYGADILPSAPASLPANKSQAIICVVDNGPFEAAGFAYNEAELQVFKEPDFGGRQRPRQWLMMDRKKACELTGFRE